VQPKLEQEYEEIVTILRSLPVHIFILKLDNSEIDARSAHPERSSAWQKFQQQIVDKHAFHDRLERQQTLILDAAKKQKIPYSVIKVTYEPEISVDPRSITGTQSQARRASAINPTGAKIPRKKRPIPTTL
jgi:hypothetical protein